MKCCIIFSTADWNEPYWTNKQHCAVSLSKLGWSVIYVESVGLRTPSAKSRKDIARLLFRSFKGFKSLIRGASIVEKNIKVL